MKMLDIATSNQGGRDLASFVGTMNWLYFYLLVFHWFVDFTSLVLCVEKGILGFDFQVQRHIQKTS